MSSLCSRSEAFAARAVRSVLGHERFRTRRLLSLRVHLETAVWVLYGDVVLLTDDLVRIRAMRRRANDASWVGRGLSRGLVDIHAGGGSDPRKTRCALALEAPRPSVRGVLAVPLEGHLGPGERIATVGLRVSARKLERWRRRRLPRAQGSCACACAASARTAEHSTVRQCASIARGCPMPALCKMCSRPVGRTCVRKSRQGSEHVSRRAALRN